MAINKNTQLRNRIKRLEEENQELRNRLASFEQLKAFMVANRHKLSRRYWNSDSFEHKLIDALYTYIVHGLTFRLRKYISQYIRETIPETKRREFIEWRDEEERELIHRRKVIIRKLNTEKSELMDDWLNDIPILKTLFPTRINVPEKFRVLFEDN